MYKYIIFLFVFVLFFFFSYLFFFSFCFVVNALFLSFCMQTYTLLHKNNYIDMPMRIRVYKYDICEVFFTSTWICPPL